MHKPIRVAFVALLLASLVVGLSSPAFATTAGGPTRLGGGVALAALASGPISVQIGPGEEGNNTVAIIGVILDPSVKLPARVRLPIPVGASVQWAGEVLGGDPNADPEHTPKIADGAGGAQYAEFTVTQSHTAQIDTFAGQLTTSGKTVTTQVNYVQSVPATSVVFSVRLPAGVTNVQLSPSPTGPADKNPAGESLYQLGGGSPSTGQKQTISISYTLGVATPPTTSSNQTPAFVAVGVALVAVVIALTFVLRRGRVSDDAGDESDDEGADASGYAEDSSAADTDEAPSAALGDDVSAADDSNDPFDGIDMD